MINRQRRILRDNIYGVSNTITKHFVHRIENCSVSGGIQSSFRDWTFKFLDHYIQLMCTEEDHGRKILTETDLKTHMIVPTEDIESPSYKIMPLEPFNRLVKEVAQKYDKQNGEYKPFTVSKEGIKQLKYFWIDHSLNLFSTAIHNMHSNKRSRLREIDIAVAIGHWTFP